MSIVWPKGRSMEEAKKVASTVQGRFETRYPRIVYGTVDSTGPTIIRGVGFTVAKNGTGDVTLTFDPPFSDVPVITTCGRIDAASGGGVILRRGAATASTVRLVGRDLTGAAADGEMDFEAIGPIG